VERLRARLRLLLFPAASEVPERSVDLRSGTLLRSISLVNLLPVIRALAMERYPRADKSAIEFQWVPIQNSSSVHFLWERAVETHYKGHTLKVIL
jgi:hypothetical protein